MPPLIFTLPFQVPGYTEPSLLKERFARVNTSLLKRMYPLTALGRLVTLCRTLAHTRENMVASQNTLEAQVAAQNHQQALRR